MGKNFTVRKTLPTSMASSWKSKSVGVVLRQDSDAQRRGVMDDEVAEAWHRCGDVAVVTALRQWWRGGASRRCSTPSLIGLRF